MSRCLAVAVVLAIFPAGCGNSSGGKNTTIYVPVPDANQAPIFVSHAPATAEVNSPYVYDIFVIDVESGTSGLAITQSASDTCGGTLTDHGNGTGRYSFTPGVGLLGAQCVVGLNVSDGDASSGQDTPVSVVAGKNTAPAWLAAPTGINVLNGESYDSTNGTATDADLPQQTLTCSSVASTCSFAVTVGGSGASPRDCSVSFTAGSAPETCSVEVRVDDGNGEAVTHAIPITVSQCVVYVDNTASGANDGSSWANAYTSIQAGVDAATPECDVWVAEGRYTDPDSMTLLTMKDGVRIYGGFAGTEAALSDRVDPLGHATVIDGEHNKAFMVIGANDALLDGFHLANAMSASDGVALTNDSKTNMTVSNCMFSGNSVYGGGGAINNSNSTVTITDSIFLGNIATNGISSNGSSLTIARCRFLGNSYSWGGGINNSYSSGTITDCTFAGNSGLSGGGIYNNNSSPVITNCTFSQNSAAAGGGIYNLNSSPVITNCVFDQNSAAGGGIYNSDSSPTVSNCLFSNNKGSFGGGIYNSGSSSPTIRSCTFAENSASNTGGAICSSGSPTLMNVVMWGNTSPGKPAICDTSSTVTYSDIQGGYAGTGNINADPEFRTGLLGRFYLSALSPGVDKGSGTPASWGLEGTTTSMFGYADVGVVDMGYHYPIP